MRTILIPLLMPILIACSSFAASGGAAEPVIVNRTATPLVYVGFDLVLAPVVDPNPTIDPDDARDRLVAAGAEAPIHIADYEGGGILLFIYEFPTPDHTGSVRLSRTVRVTRQDLTRMNNRIVIE